VRYLVSRGRVAEAERTVADIEIKASEGKPLPPLAAVPAGVEERGVTVLELLIPERRKRTILLWIVSFCFLWSANGIIFMLPQILVQRGFELRQIFGFLFVQAVAAFVGYTACAFPHRPLWPPAGPVPVLFRRRVFPSLVRARNRPVDLRRYCGGRLGQSGRVRLERGFRQGAFFDPPARGGRRRGLRPLARGVVPWRGC